MQQILLKDCSIKRGLRDRFVSKDNTIKRAVFEDNNHNNVNSLVVRDRQWHNVNPLAIRAMQRHNVNSLAIHDIQRKACMRVYGIQCHNANFLLAIHDMQCNKVNSLVVHVMQWHNVNSQFSRCPWYAVPQY
ncbi:hypothetical protein CDAR_472361 [Caerostris darwini]|uniref:Uncharacterized protein n=1 Tax=Caerostris darwini TaxID=1538125 RepID=A0AAV4VNK2_9ARAC|nr:hypothetical protein CDAR_472361 [Caerostris darwini]